MMPVIKKKIAVIKTNTVATRTNIEAKIEVTKIKTEVIGTKINIRAAAMMKRNHHHQKIRIGSIRVLHQRNTNPKTVIKIVKKIVTRVTNTEVKKTNTPAQRINTGRYYFMNFIESK